MSDHKLSLPKSQYREMAKMSDQTLREHFEHEDLLEYLVNNGWDVEEVEVADGTSRTWTRHKASKRGKVVGPIKGANARYRISEIEGLTLRGLWVEVIEHRGGLKQIDREPRMHPHPDSELKR